MEEENSIETSEPEDEEPEDIDSLKEALEEEKAKAEKYLSNWQRSEADFNNYKKRVEQERSEIAKFANLSLILNLLPVMDDFERAFNTTPGKSDQVNWADGISLIFRKLQAILQTQGISEIKATGEQFDPSIHEAVGQGEGEEGKIIEEMQKGYKLGARLIRPALVVVGQGKKAQG
jgi:molecular chaperone GrpE